MKSSGPVSLEPVFQEGVSVAKVLERDELERLDGPTYEKVRSRMVGFTVGREEIIVVAPATDFFLKLAREKGTSADRAFFEARSKTHPDGSWPAYIAQQTDYSGCHVFDGKTLTSLYGVWIAFRKSYPNQYQEAVQTELAGIEKALTSSCVCGGEDEFKNELQGFLKAYPDSSAANVAAARLQEVKNKTSKVRFYCKAG